MHIPRGWWHQATRTGIGSGFSLHATFGLTRRTGVDWLAWVADQARANELFRRDLDQHSGPHDRDTQQRELTAAATRLVQTHYPADYLATRQRKHTITRQVTTFGVFAAALADTLIAEGICAEVTPDLAEGYAGMLTPTPA